MADQTRLDENVTTVPVHPGPVQPLGRHDGRLTYTIDEAAALLRISRSTAYECAQRGELPVLRLGRRILVTRQTLERLLGLEGVRPVKRPIRRRSYIARRPDALVAHERLPTWARPHRRRATES
jgi:excisionase family DNA binding protein